MCVDANVYHRDTCRLWRRVLIMFCSLCFFRYEWSKFALLYLVFKSFLEVKGGCMGIVKTRGDSSQILEENNDNATCKRSQEIWLQSVVFNLLNVPHIVPGCHIQQPGIPPKMLEWSRCVAKGRTSCKPVFDVEKICGKKEEKQFVLLIMCVIKLISQKRACRSFSVHQWKHKPPLVFWVMWTIV